MKKPSTSNSAVGKTRKRAFADAGRLAAELIAAPLVGTFIGVILQKRWPALNPWALIVGFSLGVAAFFWSLYKFSERYDGADRPRSDAAPSKSPLPAGDFDDEDSDDDDKYY